MKIYSFILIALLVILYPSAYAEIITTSGAGDGEYHYYYYSEHYFYPVYDENGYPMSQQEHYILTEYDEVNTSGSTSNIKSAKQNEWRSPSWELPNTPGIEDTRCAIFIFPIANLLGRNLEPGSATLNIYRMFNGKIVHSDDLGSTVTAAHGAYRNANGFAQVSMNNVGWASVDVTSQLQKDIIDGHSNATFVFRIGEYNPYLYVTSAGYISTSESGNGAYLNIVPEPSSIIALLCGISGLGVIVRRKR